MLRSTERCWGRENVERKEKPRKEFGSHILVLIFIISAETVRLPGRLTYQKTLECSRMLKNDILNMLHTIIQSTVKENEKHFNFVNLCTLIK